MRFTDSILRSAFGCLTLVASLGLANSSVVLGQLTEPIRRQLAVELQTTASNLSADQLPKFELAVENANQSITSLRQYLRSVADPQRTEAWLDYVDYDRLTTAIENGDSAIEQGRIAREIYWRLSRNVEGLEREPILMLRSSLKRLYESSFFEDQEKVAKTVALQIEKMAETLEESGDVLTPDEAARLNYLLRLINSTGLAPGVESRLQAYIGRPNVRVSIGSDIIQNAVTRPVMEQNPSDECILGTRVISQTELNGNVTARLIPSVGAARIQLMLSARFQSNGTGYNRKVRVANRGYGDVTATRDLFISDGGVELGSVSSSASLNSQILGIEHPLRLVRRIAAKRAAEQKGQANAIAEAKLESRVSGEFSEQTASQVKNGNLLPKAQVATVLTRLDLDQPIKNWSSTEHFLQLELTVKNGEQTTTAVPPPGIVNGYDVVVQIHESAINNSASSILGERLLRDGEIRQFLASLVPAELRENSPLPVSMLVPTAGSAEEKIEIAFRPLRPIIFEARDGVVRLGLRGSRFKNGDQVLDRSLEITASYKPIRQASGTVRLERVGKVEVVIPTAGGRGLSLADRALRTAIERRFENVFPAVLLDPPFEIANPATAGKPPKPLRIKAIQPRNGWLTLHLN